MKATLHHVMDRGRCSGVRRPKEEQMDLMSPLKDAMILGVSFFFFFLLLRLCVPSGVAI